MLNGLSLFSGIGGLDVALSRYVVARAYCEIDPYCQSILLSRMSEKKLANGPIWDDITTFDGIQWSGCFDIIYGGFPCQDISIAGLGAGLEGKQSRLFFEIMRLAKEIKPKFIFLENVPAITRRGGVDVVKAAAEMGYDCRWCVISAASIGALHRRERWFLLAYSESVQSFRLSSGKEEGQPFISMSCEYGREDKWKKAVSSMGKLSDGVPRYLDRLRALGNAVVPLQAREAFEILVGIS